MAGAVLTTEQWKRVLLDEGVLGVHLRWPADEPFAVSARAPMWLTECRLVLRPTGELQGLKDAQVVQLLDVDCWNCFAAGVDASVYQRLGPLPVGVHRISFHIEAWSENAWEKHFRPDAGRPWFADYYSTEAERKAADAYRAAQKPRPLSTGELDVEVEIVPTLDGAILPVSTPELDRAVREALSVRFDDDWNDERSAALFVSDSPALEQLGLSLAVELVEGDESRWSAHLVPRDRNPWHDIELGGVPLPLPVALEHDSDARRAWTLRVRGTNENILRDWKADRRWSGTLEVGLGELLARGAERGPRAR